MPSNRAFAKARDPTVTSVGYGGWPDRDGQVTLDACIMNAEGSCGSVACLSHIKHPISVARRVMEKTPHVMLVGEGALQFALAQGFRKETLLTEEARQAWEKWKASQAPADKAPGNAGNHDTIGMVALDSRGNLSGGLHDQRAGLEAPGACGRFADYWRGALRR